MQESSILNMKPKPKMRGCGGRKCFLPRIMKLPVVRYSPVGAALDTCAAAANMALIRHAILQLAR